MSLKCSWLQCNQVAPAHEFPAARSKPLGSLFMSFSYLRREHLAHLVLSLSLGLAEWILSLELVRDLNIKITWVLGVWSVGEDTTDLFSLLDGQDITEVEDGLLPVSVLGVWAGREADWLVAGGEIDVEPGDDGVDEVVAAGVEEEWGSEGQVGESALVEVEGQDGGWVGHNGLDLDGVDEWLGEGSLLEWGVVEAIDVVPEVDLLVLVVSVLDSGNEDGGLIWEDQAAWNKVLVTGPEDGIQHGLVKEEVTHPLGDDDVDLWEWEDNILHLALKKGNLVGKTVDLDDLLSLDNDGGHVDTDNVLCASLCGEPIQLSDLVPCSCGLLRCALHGENTGSAADIENDLVLEQVLVLDDGVHVGTGADLILQHLLVDSMVVVAVKMLAKFSLLDRQAPRRRGKDSTYELK